MITFSGISSGLDSSAIIEQLVSAERLPIARLNLRKSDTERQISIVGDLTSKLKSLEEAAEGLDTPDEVRAVKVNSSDDSIVKATVSSSALPATYNVKVTSLAQAQTSASKTFASDQAGAIATGSVSITVGTDAAIDISYDASDSLQDIATRINDSDARVVASVVNNGSTYQLLVVGKDSGAANAITFSGTGETLDLATGELVAAGDASFTINGLAVTRADNLVDDLITGVTFELEGTTAAADEIVIQVQNDSEGLRTKVQEFVDKYNAVTGLLNAQLSYVGQQRGPDTLFGDSTLRALQRRMGGILATAYPNGSGTTSTAAVGLSLSTTGVLSLDATQFDAALAADKDVVNNLFAASSTALAGSIASLANDYTQSGTGFLVNKTSRLQGRITSFDDQIERFERAASGLEERLIRQFSALEQNIAGFQAQSSFLASIFTI